MRIPIACTLTASDAGDRVQEWRRALAGTVSSVDRPQPSRAELRLGGDAAALGELVALAQQEKACCPFFSFAFEVAADAVTLVVTVPEDAAAVLDDFAGLVAHT